MGADGPKTRRRPRADFLRNRDLLLAAATEVFGTGDRQASLEAVARAAGVGIGTLYRHFPTREALFEAVYRHEVDQLGDLAARLAEDADPVEAIRRWIRANVRLATTKRGMVEALQLAAYGSTELKAYSSARMVAAIRRLLDRAIAAGVVRNDVSPEDLLKAMAGIIYAQASPDWQPVAERLLDVFVDGLTRRP